MIKKISVVALTAFLVFGVTTPVQAATSGGSCPSAGAKTKIGKNNYTCAKNPFYNTTKLTWVFNGCINNYSSEYVAAVSQAKKEVGDAEVLLRNQVEPLGDSLRALITWNSLITYKKSEVVYYGFTYYAATKTNVNKAPTAANIGSQKFWVVYQPTIASSKIGQMPTPTKVIATANTHVAALSSTAARTTNSTAKAGLTDLSSSIAAKIITLEANRAPIEGVLITTGDILESAKQIFSLSQILSSEVKDSCKP